MEDGSEDGGFGCQVGASIGSRPRLAHDSHGFHPRYPCTCRVCEALLRGDRSCAALEPLPTSFIALWMEDEAMKVCSICPV